jgi:3',5'-cyclic AMP phosphodiesterase CpdA/Tfp pilus assembly protein PilF
MANKITILHLSDMQFGIHHRFGTENTELDTLLERLYEDLSGLEKSHDLKPDLVVLTGDLTEWGKKPEFEDLFLFVSGLSKKLNIPHKRIIMIPGNHDVNRVKCRLYFENLEEEGLKPQQPYWQKWEFYKQNFDKFYSDEPDIQFTQDRPYSLFAIEELKVVIAGLNSTMRESHLDDDHYGWVGENQLKWFKSELDQYKQQGWFRIAAVHHNVQRGAADDNENLKDADDLKHLLKDSVNLLLHGHTHQTDLAWLTNVAPILATGSAALKKEIRPDDTPNQYQIIQVSSGGLKRYCRAFVGPQKEWRWDNHVHKNPDNPLETSKIAFEKIAATFDDDDELLIPAEQQAVGLSPIAVKPLQINSTNVPKPRDFFTGRKQELKDFSDILTRSNLATLEGLGGIGKTEFAAEYIKKNLSTNNVVWFDCETSDTLDALIAQAGYVDLLKGENKTDLAKYSGFVDLIERDQQFLFLDNFQENNDPQFIEFFKFAERKLKQARLILISREHPKIDGIPSIAGCRLKGLGDEHALDYALAIQQHFYPDIQIEPGALAEICKDLDGHPLAIEFAFQLLGYGESYQNISRKIVEYKEDSQELSRRLLAEVFEHPNSTEEEKQLLCQFAIFRGKVSREAITAINDNQNPMPILTRLINKLMISVSEQKYQTHPLIREFCYQKLDNPKSLHQKAAIYFQQGINDNFSLPLIEQAFYHLNQAQNWHGATELIQQQAESLLLTGHYQFLQTMMLQAEQQGIIETAFNLYHGTIAQVKGEWKQALAYFKQVFSTPLANEKVVLEALNRYGEMCWRKGDYQDALAYFEQAYQRSEGFDKAKADALHGMGLVYDNLGDLYKAEQKYQQGLNIRQEINDKKGIAISLNDLASILKQQKKQDEALKIYKQSLNLREEIDDKEGIARSLSNISTIFIDKENLIEALKKQQQSLNIRQEIGDKEGIAISLTSIGSIFRMRGNFPEALKRYKQGLSIRQEIGDEVGIGDSLNRIGIWHREQKNYSSAIFYYVQALALQNKIGLKADAKAIENNIFLVRGIIKLKKLKPLLDKAYSDLSEELKPFFDISIFIQDNTVHKQAGKLLPNAHCPCGSGLKYKKCCAASLI